MSNREKTSPMNLARLHSIVSEYRDLAEEFGGIPQSELREVPTFQKTNTRIHAGSLPGKWFVKLDSNLPIAGSVKLRGGLYEILKYAATLENTKENDRGRRFEGYTITVASTGNLGMSVGLSSRNLGFSVKVYMSKEASPWKMEKLRESGAEVVLVDGDYNDAVALCRKESAEQGYYFVDDERSTLLYEGYAASAVEIAEDERVQEALRKEAPIFVYLPCGVGNSPSGIAAGLKAVLGDKVHIFLAEPTEVPSVLVGMLSGKGDAVSVYDYGLSGATVADGLACARMSATAGKVLEQTISGIYTITDEEMLAYLKILSETEGIRVEPSAAASLKGLSALYYTKEGMEYLRQQNLLGKMEHSVHISWLTGGSMVPDEEYRRLLREGEKWEKSLCDFL